METFSALLALFAGNSPVTDEFHSQRPMTRSFDVFFYLRRDKRLSKHPRGWWFATPSPSLWRHCNISGVFESRRNRGRRENIYKSQGFTLKICRTDMPVLGVIGPTLAARVKCGNGRCYIFASILSITDIMQFCNNDVWNSLSFLV